MRETCPDCFAETTRVDGVARNLSRRYGNGTQYLRGPHYLTCDGDRVQAEINERITRERRQRVLARYAGLLREAHAAGRITADDAATRAMAATSRMAR